MALKRRLCHIKNMIALYPGSFDPLTKGHLDIIRRALAFCPQLVVAIGSSATKQNLFTAEEREDMILQAMQESFSKDEISRVRVCSYEGATVLFAEKIGATLLVKGMRSQNDYAAEEKMVIVNRRLTKKIDTVFLMTENDLRDVSSSAVREMAKIGLAPQTLDHYLTPSVRDALLAKYR